MIRVMGFMLRLIACKGKWTAPPIGRVLWGSFKGPWGPILAYCSLISRHGLVSMGAAFSAYLTLLDQSHKKRGQTRTGLDPLNIWRTPPLFNSQPGGELLRVHACIVIERTIALLESTIQASSPANVVRKQASTSRRRLLTDHNLQQHRSEKRNNSSHPTRRSRVHGPCATSFGGCSRRSCRGASPAAGGRTG